MPAEIQSDPYVFEISRTFDVPRELVWKSVTEVERLKQWWGPRGYKVIHAAMDFRVGGTYLYGLRAPEGVDIWGKFTFREIEPMSKMLFINSFSDPDGGVTRHPASETWPLQLMTTFTFTESDGKTTYHVRWEPYQVSDVEMKTFAEGKESMQAGWTGTLDQLEAYLARQ